MVAGKRSQHKIPGWPQGASWGTRCRSSPPAQKSRPRGGDARQSATGPATGTYEPGIDDWKVVKDRSGFTLHRDDALGTAWLYDGNTFWTFDDEIALTHTADWAQAQGLGGVMIWSIDGDDAGGSLMAAVDAALAS
ncbi:hypothetical protein BJF83_22105 [Nocardiopsis sp. CNR-923]|nr:hypothetical protein BJF83_22105 [Nocardiopsis sp. CNR-923]